MNRKIILNAYISCFNGDILSRYGSIHVFCQYYPNASKKEIISSLGSFLENEKTFVEEMQKSIESLDNELKQELFNSLSILINSAIREFDLPNEKGFIKSRLINLFKIDS